MAATIPITRTVRAPRWALRYRGVAISGRISQMVLSIAYISKAGGAGNELEIAIEDRDRRWQGPWLPTRGDRVSLDLGYAGEPMAPAGEFEVDELELKAPPDVMTMRCLAAFITPAMRTETTRGWESTTLLHIADTIAAKHGLAVVGAPDAINVSFMRVTQNRESDLAFLRRIAGEHNYEFQVRGKTLVFYSRTALEQAPAVAAFRRADLESFSFKTRAHEIFKGAEGSYLDPTGKASIVFTVPADPPQPTGDTLKIHARTESGQQAALKAQSALHGANMLFITGTLATQGNVALAGGANIMLSELGAFSGKYQIQTATHKLDRQAGYKTELEVRNVA